MPKVTGEKNGANSYHQLAHFFASTSGKYPARYPEMKRKLQKFYAKEFADFLGSLQAVREGSGTLLDNTLAYWANGMTKGGHKFDAPGIPFVLMVGKNVAAAAGLGMGTGGGRYIKYGGTSHVQLLTSLGHIMGLKDGGTPLPGLV